MGRMKVEGDAVQEILFCALHETANIVFAQLLVFDPQSLSIGFAVGK